MDPESALPHINSLSTVPTIFVSYWAAHALLAMHAHTLYILAVNPIPIHVTLLPPLTPSAQAFPQAIRFSDFDSHLIFPPVLEMTSDSLSLM